MFIILLQQIIDGRSSLVVMSEQKSNLKVHWRFAYFAETENFLLKIL